MRDLLPSRLWTEKYPKLSACSINFALMMDVIICLQYGESIDVFGPSCRSRVKAGAQSRCTMIILPCAYCLSRYCIYIPICTIETIFDPCETLVTHINQLENFTHLTSEASWTTRGSWPMEIARVFLIIPAPSWQGAEENDLPSPPTHKLTHWRGKGECNQRVGE